MAEEKKAYHHGNLKAVLAEAALAMVAESGLEAFTLREVARRAGVSHNAPYRHFKSREDLIAVLATEGLLKINREVAKAVKAAKDPSARVYAAARAYLKFGMKHPAEFKAMFHGAFEREAYPEYVAAYSESLNILSGLMESHTGKGDAAELAGDLLWATIHGITELGIAKRLRHGEMKALEELAECAVDSLLKGTGKRAGN